jgi:hypothetical protein
LACKKKIGNQWKLPKHHFVNTTTAHQIPTSLANKKSSDLKRKFMVNENSMSKMVKAIKSRWQNMFMSFDSIGNVIEVISL